MTIKAEDKVIVCLITIISKINNGCTIISFKPEKHGGLILPESYKIDEITDLHYDSIELTMEQLELADKHHIGWGKCEPL